MLPRREAKDVVPDSYETIDLVGERLKGFPVFTLIA